MPQFISILLFIVTAIVNKTVPSNIDGYDSFKEEISSNLFAKHRNYMTIIFIILRFIQRSLIWICYIVFFYIMIYNKHNVKNWVSAIIVACVMYIHLKHGI